MRHPPRLGTGVRFSGRLDHGLWAPSGRLGSGCALLAGTIGFWTGAAYGGEMEEANARLVDLDARVRSLSGEFRDETGVDPSQGERRVLDAELLFNLKNYREAATINLKRGCLLPPEASVHSSSE